MDYSSSSSWLADGVSRAAVPSVWTLFDADRTRSRWWSSSFSSAASGAAARCEYCQSSPSGQSHQGLSTESAGQSSDEIKTASIQAITSSTTPSLSSTSLPRAPPAPASSSPPAASPQGTPKPWVHFAAGGVGGMCGALITSPLDVVKTRLQSDMYQKAAGKSAGRGGARGLLWNFVETGYLLGEITRKEGPRALFKGLGPTLVGVIPARAINFYSYGNGKRVLAERFNSGKESPLVHLSAAAIAGIVTATATNPIWVVKTRMQLENQAHQRRAEEGRKLAVGVRQGSHAATSVVGKTLPGSAAGYSTAGVAAPASTASTFFKPKPTPQRPSTNSVQMTLQILKREGVQGLYKGMSASYLGVAEGTIQWVLYERLKSLEKRSATGEVTKERKVTLSNTISSASIAKLVASIITYPHEVVRTRLRQEPEPGMPRKYRGLVQTVKLVAREEGIAALYGGLSAHLLRVVPNAAVMFSIYELFLRFAPRDVP